METQPLSKLIQADLENYDSLYSDVELTKEEISKALYEVRKAKDARLKMEAYTKKLKENPVYPQYSAEQILEMVKKIPGFVIDEFNESIIWELCLYFTDDIRCSLDRKRGLMLYGGVGCGKTTLMNFFNKNQVSSYVVYSVREISYEYGKHGSDAIMKYKGLLKTSSPEIYFGQRELGLCFDDLGTEVDKKHYGNESNVMAEIILNRYDGIKFLGAKTHITTNLNTTQLEERYGYRFRSRCREMFNVVIFEDSAPDRRK